MLRTLKSRAIVASILMCVAGPAARADEIQYLPDGCFFVFSADMSVFLKSKLFAELKTQVEGFDKVLHTDLRERLGVPIENVGRITMGVMDTAGPKGELGILTALKPIKAADVLAVKKPFPFQKDYTHKEVKVGKHTVYEESYRYDFFKDKDETVKGQAFCVVEDKIMVFGRLEAVKKVLERDKKPALSDGVSAELKKAGLTGHLTIIVDLPAFPERERTSMSRDLDKAIPGVAEVFDSIRTVTLRASTGDKVTATAALACKDKASAASTKKVADTGLAKVKGLLIEIPGDPQEIKKAKSQVLAAVNAVKLSASDAQVQAEAAIEAAEAASVMRALFMTKKAEKKFKDLKDAK